MVKNNIIETFSLGPNKIIWDENEINKAIEEKIKKRKISWT